MKAADLSDGQTVTTLGGEELTVHINGGTITFTAANGGTVATVVTADLMSCSGVVHIISEVLIPGDEELGGGDEPPAGGEPVEETPVGETPAGETPVEETPVGETPVGETPVEETPVGETPVGETPAGETPAGETPAGETPVGGTPVEETPAEETPAGEETPVEEVPVVEEPVGGDCSSLLATASSSSDLSDFVALVEVCPPSHPHPGQSSQFWSGCTWQQG